MTRLDPSIRAGWIAHNKDKEGVIPWPYLCRRKVWTVAIGVTPSLALAYTYRWIVSATRQPATRADVDEAWHALMSAPAAVRDRIAQIGASEARKHVKIELPPDELERVTLVRFDEFEAALLKTYPAMATWPAEAQTVCMSIAWAAGTGAAFPKMYAAMYRGDWLTAADECALRVDMPDGFRNTGLIPRNHHNRALLLALAERTGQVPQDRPSSPPVVIVEDEAIPDTDPMTDQQRAETLALVHATMATSLAEDRAEGYHRR
jgi:GH24 family phage-related lysozyme (muramidase)